MNCTAGHGEIRGKLRSLWPEWSAILVFAGLVAYAIPYHEPWVDEAQAWQLSRSLSLGELFHTFIRYEASPGLWHFLLWMLIRAHVSYAGLHWICGAIAVLSTSLFVLKSPFPRYLKLALPFSCFLLYQYAVIARSYVLVPLILFLIAHLWKRDPIWVALLLGMLANLSLHAAVISGGLAIVYAIQYFHNRDTTRPHSRQQLLFCVILLLVLYGFSIWTAWPPHDLLISSFRKSSRPFFIWAVTSLVWGVCEPWLISIPFWIAILLSLRARRSLIYIVPVLLFAVFSGAVYAAFQHMGLLVPLILCILWITWPKAKYGTSRYEMAGRIALVVMTVTQILWSVYSITYDHTHAYSPGLATAEFLRSYAQGGELIAVSFIGQPDCKACDDVAILPYFDRNIFLNQPYSFWWWSDRNRTEDAFLALLPSHPRIVVVEARLNPGESINWKDDKFNLLINSGYRFIFEACGTIPLRLQLGITSCNLIYERPNSP